MAHARVFETSASFWRGLVAPVVLSGVLAWGAGAADAGASSDYAVKTNQVNEQLAKLVARTHASTTAPATMAGANRVQARNEANALASLANDLPGMIQAEEYDKAARAVQTALRQVDDAAARGELAALSESLTAVQAESLGQALERERAFLKALPERLGQAKRSDDLRPLLADVKRITRRAREGQLPPDVRDQFEEMGQQLSQADNLLRRFGDMLDAEAAGDVDAALAAVSQLSQQREVNGRPLLGREVLHEHVVALEKRRDLAARQAMDDLAKKVRAATSAEEVEHIAQDVRASVDRSQRQGMMSPQQQQFFQELQALQAWSKVLDLEAKGKYRTALGALADARPRLGDGRPVSRLVGEDMLAQKARAIQQRLTERGDEVTEPLLKQFADAIEAAKSLDELQKTASAIDLSQTGRGLDADADNMPVVQELSLFASQVRTLGEMKRALTSGEWGRFWQCNGAVVAARGMNGMDAGRVHAKWAAKLDEQRLALIRQAVVASAELAPLNIKLAATEPLDRAMYTAADDAITDNDYRRAVLILRAYALFAYGTDQGQFPGQLSTSARADIQGLELFAQGQSFEAANDLGPAVARYRAVVQLTGPHVPIKAAEARLAAIGKARPDLFRTAATQESN